MGLIPEYMYNFKKLNIVRLIFKICFLIRSFIMYTMALNLIVFLLIFTTDLRGQESDCNEVQLRHLSMQTAEILDHQITKIKTDPYYHIQNETYDTNQINQLKTRWSDSTADQTHLKYYIKNCPNPNPILKEYGLSYDKNNNRFSYESLENANLSEKKMKSLAQGLDLSKRLSWDKSPYDALNLMRARLELIARFRPLSEEEVRVYKKDLEESGKKIHKSFLSNLMEKGEAAIEEEKKSCTNIDLRGSKLGPVRDQDGAGWCFAFPAADLLSYRLGKKISAASINFSYHDYNKLSSEKSATFFIVDEGSPNTAIETAINHGLCLEEEIASESPYPYRQKLDLIESETLKFGEQNPYRQKLDLIESETLKFGEQTLCEDLNAMNFFLSNIPTIFKSITEKKIIDIYNSKLTPMKRLDEVMENSCNRIKPQEEIKIKNHYFGSHPTEKRFEMFPLIDDQLEKENPVSLGYNVLILFGIQCPKDKACNHASLIVGRRWKKSEDGKEQCQYLIRNSWGRGCEGYIYDCEEGNIWVPKEELLLHSKDIQYIE